MEVRGGRRAPSYAPNSRYSKEALKMKYKMKQKQNQRITQITEATLVVGADIAKKIHVARAVDYRGIELGKDLAFHNDQNGLMQLAICMKELGEAPVRK